MNTRSGMHRNPFFIRWSCQWIIKGILPVVFLATPATSSLAFAEDRQTNVGDIFVDRATAVWRDGDAARALEILNPGIQEHGHALTLQKLRGDILATSRRHEEAVEAYEDVLQQTPKAVNIRWAKWSVLMRSGQGDEAIAELQRIAQHDTDNPLIHLRLAQELRKLDRLEESLEWYKKAVTMVPDLPGWRLALARARFDVLDGRGARDEVEEVLKMVKPGSPEETMALGLRSVISGATKERGRRFEPILSPDGTAAERKEWAAIRADAWRLFEAGRYQEAEPLLRKVLQLNPSDHGATHDLGMTLFKLDRCEEAIPVLEKVLSMTAADETYADTFFRIGQCLARLERWSEALEHFQILHDAAVEFEEMTKDVPVTGGIRILDKDKLAKWVEKVRPHVPDAAGTQVDEASNRMPPIDPSSPAALSEEELYKKIASERLNADDPIYARASLMGRDADFSWFRFVVPASRVMRDDQLMGAHDYIPIDPGDTFPTTQQDIYLVFGLVTPSYDEVPLTAECFLERSTITGNQSPLAQDHVIMAMNDQSGYFVLSPSEKGWTPGLYRCGLFVGGQASAYTHADEVRFRIVEPSQSS